MTIGDILRQGNDLYLTFKSKWSQRLKQPTYYI